MTALLAGVALVLAVPPVEAPPFAISAPAVATAPAVRLPTFEVGEPPVPPPAFSAASANRRCVGAEPLLEYYSPGWNVVRMSRILWRESRCTPTAYNRRGRAAGLAQITPITYTFLAGCLGEPVTRSKLMDPVFNTRAAACLWSEGGYRPWAL